MGRATSELLVRRLGLGGNYSSINCTSAGGRRGLLSSGRHLDNRQVTTCCKPRAGPGIGWVRAGHRRKLPARTRRWVTRKHEQSSNIQSIFPYSSIGNCIDTEAEDLIHSGQAGYLYFWPWPKCNTFLVS